MDPGLAKQDCTHEDTTWEYQGCSDGEEQWLCICGETILRYLDCPSR